MKPVIVFVITFVVAAAASTGAKVMTTKPSHAAADSTKADSTANTIPRAPTPPRWRRVNTRRPRSTRRLARRCSGDSSKHVAVDTKHGAPETKPAVARDPKANNGCRGCRERTRPNADTASERRLSKVFTSMEAKQAAKVLEHMADMDVHIILGYVGPRQAASIMAGAARERVAKLSKIAMNGGVR